MSLSLWLSSRFSCISVARRALTNDKVIFVTTKQLPCFTNKVRSYSSFIVQCFEIRLCSIESSMTGFGTTSRRKLSSVIKTGVHSHVVLSLSASSCFVWFSLVCHFPCGFSVIFLSPSLLCLLYLSKLLFLCKISWNYGSCILWVWSGHSTVEWYG